MTVPFEMLELLRRLEESLVQPHLRVAADPADLVAEDFLEIGASGRTYDRAAALEALSAAVGGTHVILSGFAASEVVDGVILLTYRAERNAIVSLRSSVWRREGEAWRIVFHQGTLASA